MNDAGEQLSLRVVSAKLPQRLADPLCDAAMGLSVHHHRIDRAADIVDRGVIDELQRAGLRVDLDLADVGAVREAELQDRLVAARVQWAA